MEKSRNIIGFIEKLRAEEKKLEPVITSECASLVGQTDCRKLRSLRSTCCNCDSLLKTFKSKGDPTKCGVLKNFVTRKHLGIAGFKRTFLEDEESTELEKHQPGSQTFTLTKQKKSERYNRMVR